MELVIKVECKKKNLIAERKEKFAHDTFTAEFMFIFVLLSSS